jgi:hypothetical protein
MKEATTTVDLNHEGLYGDGPDINDIFVTSMTLRRAREGMIS